MQRGSDALVFCRWQCIWGAGTQQGRGHHCCFPSQNCIFVRAEECKGSWQVFTPEGKLTGGPKTRPDLVLALLCINRRLSNDYCLQHRFDGQWLLPVSISHRQAALHWWLTCVDVQDLQICQRAPIDDSICLSCATRLSLRRCLIRLRSTCPQGSCMPWRVLEFRWSRSPSLVLVRAQP